MSRRNLSADDIRLVGQLADLQTKKYELEQRIESLETKLQLTIEALSALKRDEQELASDLLNIGINCGDVRLQNDSAIPRRGVELTTDLSTQLFAGFSQQQQQQPGNFPQQTPVSYNFPHPAVSQPVVSQPAVSPQAPKQPANRPKAKVMPSLSVRRRQ